jgi:hypothetical protein
MMDIPTWKTVLILITFIISTINALILLGDKICKALETCTDNVDLSQLDTTMFISLYSIDQTMHVEVLKIPAQIRAVIAHGQLPIQRIRFGVRRLLGRIIIDWADMTMEAGGRRILLPSTAPLPIYRLRRAKRIARNCHTIRVTLVQGVYFNFISTWTRLQAVPSNLPQPLAREIRRSFRAGSSPPTPGVPLQPDIAEFPDNSAGNDADNDDSDNPSSVSSGRGSGIQRMSFPSNTVPEMQYL